MSPRGFIARNWAEATGVLLGLAALAVALVYGEWLPLLALCIVSLLHGVAIALRAHYRRKSTD